MLLGSQTTLTDSLPFSFQLGLILFNDDARIAIKLNRYSTRDSLIKGIRRVNYNLGDTNTTGALWLMREVFFSEDNGARLGYRKIGIMITDGDETLDSQRLSQESQRVHDAGITMITFGVGGWINHNVTLLYFIHVSFVQMSLSKN